MEVKFKSDFKSKLDLEPKAKANAKAKLVLLTTAITRHELHKETIGKMYDTYFEKLNKEYELHHIINIDMPIPLRNNGFSYTRTKRQFNEIIPDNVKKYYIINKADSNPSFIKAYENIINYLNNYKHIFFTNNTIIWWLEDDWKVIKDTNFVPLLSLLNLNTHQNKNVAFSICEKAPLCSFRGGPIMNTSFFKTFFENKNLTKNPEKKVYNNLIYNNRIPSYNDIYVICIFILELCEFPFTMNSCEAEYYKRYLNHAKFNKDKTIKYILGVISESNYNKLYIKESADYNSLNVRNKSDLNEYKCIFIHDLDNHISKDCSIIYISVLPYIFEDIGRHFNKQNNLQSPIK